MNKLEKTYCVYKHTNKFNNKIYIGITCRKPEVRWNNGRGYKKNEYFYRAIQKYGWYEGFRHEILFEHLTKEEACKIESELISKYDSTNFKKGYNCSTGGECGNAGCNRSEEWINKMRKSLMKQVICVETGVVYNSLTDACKQTGVNIGGISACCHNHIRTAGGLHWCFFKDYCGKRSYFREIKKEPKKKKKKITTKKSVPINNKRHMGRRQISKCTS